MEKRHCTAVVLAAGRGKRMGAAVPKQFLEVQGKPLLYYSLAVFEQSGLMDDIILVTAAESIDYCRREVVEKYGFRKVTAVVEGGAERYHSVWNALQTIVEGDPAGGDDPKAVAEDGSYIFIHDGARPFVDQDIIRRAYEEVRRSRACVVGMPVKDTIKVADEQGFIVSTPKRSLVWQIQTPQVFASELIIPAYREVIGREQELLAQGAQITDDAMVVEMMTGRPVRLVKGSYENIKVTTPEDLTLAEVFAREK